MGKSSGWDLRVCEVQEAEADFPTDFRWISIGPKKDFGDDCTITDVEIAGQALAIVKDTSGKIYAIADKSPYLNIPLSYGNVGDGVIGKSFLFIFSLVNYNYLIYNIY